jgi:hypothetical protein
MKTITLSVMAFGLAAASAFAQANDTPAEKKGPEFKVSGKAEFDAYAQATSGHDQTIYHSYASTIDVDFNVKFNENWSAFAQIEGDGDNEAPSVIYKKAFVKYDRGDNFSLRLGDLTFSEGAFTFYRFDDAGINAAGMREHDIRGLDMQLYGLQLGVGFGRGNNDYSCHDPMSCPSEGNRSYDIHAAYQLDLNGHTLRPFIHYKSWQNKNANELHTGLDANLNFGPLALHAVYGLHANRLKKDKPNATHAFLAEPTLSLDRVTIKTGAFFAIFDDDLNSATIHGDEIPEYKFAFAEADYKVNDVFTAGLIGEWHTNTLDDTRELGTVEFGTRLYFKPVKDLKVTGFAKAIVPVGDDWEKANRSNWVSTSTDYGDDTFFSLGVETVFNF